MFWLKKLLSHYAEDVVLAHDKVILALYLNLCARVLAEKHDVAHLYLGGDDLAALVLLTWPHGHHLALCRGLLGAFGDYDAPLCHLVFGKPLYQYAVAKRFNLHIPVPPP